MKYIFIKVVRKPPFSYFFKCLTEGKRKNTIFNDFLGNFLEKSSKSSVKRPKGFVYLPIDFLKA